jgi:hypothetical protein
MEQIMNARPGAMDEGHLRAAQFFRGSVSTKMVASPVALRSLESVDVAELPEPERSKCSNGVSGAEEMSC